MPEPATLGDDRDWQHGNILALKDGPFRFGLVPVLGLFDGNGRPQASTLIE